MPLNFKKKINRKIAIDATPAINDIRAIKRYCHHLVLELAKQETELQFYLLFLGIKKKHCQLPEINSTQFTQITSTIPGRILTPLWKYFNSPKLSWWIKEHFDLVHFPGGLPYIPNNCRKRLTTLHGCASKFIPEFMDKAVESKLNKTLDFAVRYSTDFITVSETNKNEAITLWDIPHENITAIPLGVSPEFKTYDLEDEIKQTLFKRYKIPTKPFILFVGAIEPHKNIGNIINAYALLENSIREHYQLVFIGQTTPYCKYYQEQIISLGVTDNVSFIDYIQPGSLDLAYLYNMAELFVFPTYYEGWASPPLEAMKCGTPVIVSDIPSLKESTGGEAFYCDPYEPDSIKIKMQQLLEDKKLREEQIEKGKNFAHQFTWKLCAEKTLSLYNKLIIE